MLNAYHRYLNLQRRAELAAARSRIATANARAAALSHQLSLVPQEEMTLAQRLAAAMGGGQAAAERLAAVQSTQVRTRYV